MNEVKGPTLCIDFDGCVHSYEHGWHGGVLYGTLVPGFLDWAEQAARRFTLAIYSSRSADPVRRLEMACWLRLQVQLTAPQWHCTSMPDGERDYIRFLDANRAEVLVIHFAHEKPPAFLTIDDRCIRFLGDWRDEQLTAEAMANFQPWTVPGHHD